MNVDYINPILNALKDVFDDMLNLPITYDKPKLKKKGNPTYDISGVVGISGMFVGSVVISFPNQVALKIASNLLESELTRVDTDTIDAISEIANMVTGKADSEMTFEGINYSLPTVAIGRHKIAYHRDTNIISIPCNTIPGQFEVDIAYSGSVNIVMN